METSPNFWKYSLMSSEVVFQGRPKTIRSPNLSSGEEILVILDSGSLIAFGDSSIFLFVVLSEKIYSNLILIAIKVHSLNNDNLGPGQTSNYT